jgi:hypothetical protein
MIFFVVLIAFCASLCTLNAIIKERHAQNRPGISFNELHRSSRMEQSAKTVIDRNNHNISIASTRR